MATKHVYVHDRKQIWDLWEAGLLYALGYPCEFSANLFPTPLTNEARKAIYSKWSPDHMRVYSYVVED